MKITISFDKDDNTGNKKSAFRKPWFWLLIILIVSAAIRLSSKIQNRIPIDIGSDSKSYSFRNSGSESENSESALEENDRITAEEEDYPKYEKEEEQAKSKSVFHFILNLNTKKYHTKECSAAQKLTGEKRLDTDIEAENLEEAKNIIESQGYDMCGLCNR